MRGFTYRIFLTCINIFCPPAAVMILTGASWDCMLNCVFFILAVIPSHVHGFYITCTYFHRRNKVKKDRYPGGPKSMIHSEYVLNGGASNAEIERLWRKENGGSTKRSSRRNSRRQSGQRSDEESEMMHRQNSNIRRTNTNASRLSNQTSKRTQHDPRNAQYIAQDGYGAPPQPLRPGQQSTGYPPVSPVSLHMSGRPAWR